MTHKQPDFYHQKLVEIEASFDQHEGTRELSKIIAECEEIHKGMQKGITLLSRMGKEPEQKVLDNFDIMNRCIEIIKKLKSL